tara:strand:+ start:1282 stop:1962 length:681 start_codon:yes stop_codon:yes gene_type:complete
MQVEGNDLSDHLLEAVLFHVPNYGWSLRTLELGALNLGVESDVIWDIFPGGVEEVIKCFYLRNNRKLHCALKDDILIDLRTDERITLALNTLFKIFSSHREAMRRTISWLLLPQNSLIGARMLYQTVDNIWYAVGDQSIDFSFYTRRSTLAIIVMSTMLYWLDDNSAGAERTSDFIKRRVNDVKTFTSIRKRKEKICRYTGSAIGVFGRAAFERYGAVVVENRRVT